jgi:hypothetical protein
MLRLTAIVTMLLAGAAVPATAQSSRANERPVAQGIQVPGWRGRTDRSDQRMADVRFVQEGSGFRLTNGPHAVLWHPGNRASGEYTVSARLSKLRSSGSSQEESYGIFIAGTRLQGPNQNYLYCVVFGTGSVMVRHRNGSETATLLGKTAARSVSRMGPDGVTDEVSMWVRGGRVGCSVNGAEVFSAARESMLGPGKLVSTDGVFGLRVSHNLDLRIEGLGVTPP